MSDVSIGITAAVIYAVGIGIWVYQAARRGHSEEAFAGILWPLCLLVAPFLWLYDKGKSQANKEREEIRKQKDFLEQAKLDGKHLCLLVENLNKQGIRVNDWVPDLSMSNSQQRLDALESLIRKEYNKEVHYEDSSSRWQAYFTGPLKYTSLSNGNILTFWPDPGLVERPKRKRKRK